MRVGKCNNDFIHNQSDFSDYSDYVVSSHDSGTFTIIDYKDECISM